jgi:hypothetical protein
VQIQITITDEKGSSTRIVGAAGVNETGPGVSSTEATRSGSGTSADVSAGGAPAEPSDSSVAPKAGAGPLVGIDAGPAPAAFSSQ